MKSDDQGWRTIIKLLVVAGFLLFIVSLGMHHASGTQQHPAHKMAKAAQQATPPSDQATSHLTNLQKKLEAISAKAAQKAAAMAAKLAEEPVMTAEEQEPSRACNFYDERGLSYRYIGKRGYLHTFTPIINSKYFILEQGNGEKIYWKSMYGIITSNGYMTRTELYNERKVRRSAMQDLMDGCMSSSVRVEYYRKNQEIKELKENIIIEKQQELKREKMRELAHKKVIEQHLIYAFSRKIENKIYRNWVITSAKQGAVTVDVHLSKNGIIIGEPKLLNHKENKKIYDSIVVAIEKSAPFTPPKGLPYSVWENLILKFRTNKILVG